MLKSTIAYKRNALGYSGNKIFIWVFSVKDIICVKLFGVISSKTYLSPPYCSLALITPYSAKCCAVGFVAKAERSIGSWE